MDLAWLSDREAWGMMLRRINRMPYRSRVAVWVASAWQEHLTRAGRFVLCASLVTGIAGSFQAFMVGATAFSAFAALTILSVAATFAHRPRLLARRKAPVRCAAGTGVPLGITVENPTDKEWSDVGAYEFRLPTELKLEGDAQYLAGLAPGERHTFTFTLRAGRRGHYRLPGPSLLCAAPFGMMQARRFFPQPHALRVYPAFHPLRSLQVPTGLRYQPGGLALTSKLGQSMEFIGNREYQAGDRIQDLHPRSWARLGFPVVKQFQEEYLTRIALLVDTFLPWTGEPLLEANLALAAAVADALARQEYVVDLFAAGPELYHFQAGRSLAYLDNILDILACLERCPRDPLERIAPRLAEELRQISTLICLLVNWDEPRRQFLHFVRQAGVEVKAVVVARHDRQADQYRAAGAPQVVTVQQVRQGIDTL